MTTSPDDVLGPSTEASGGEERAELARLRQQLAAERERSLNATDQVLGAQAEAAQARAEIKELEYRLHVREAELAQVRELLDQAPEVSRSPVGRAARAVADRAGPGARQLASRLRNRVR